MPLPQQAGEPHEEIMMDRHPGGDRRQARIRITPERVRDAASAGQVPFSDDLVRAINDAVNDAFTWTMIELERTPVTDVRSGLKRIRKTVKRAADALSDLERKDGPVNEAIRSETAKAADLAGSGTLDDVTAYQSLRSTVSMLQALHRELEWREQEMVTYRGRPKSPERPLILSLYKIYLASGGTDTLSWVPPRSEFCGPSVDFINTILDDPKLVSVLPKPHAKVGALIREWRRSSN